MSNYRLAATDQWFQDDFPGATMHLTKDTAVVVLHTTEGATWPSYDGGAVAPNYTAKPNFRSKTLEWRAHFPDEKSSRALQNLSGGVETNTLNAVQVELIGTCDPTHRQRWGDVHGLKVNEDYIYWPDAPAWALRALAAFIADFHKRHGLQLTAPTFLPYPESFADSPVRFSFRDWSKFAGVCGHQHVPENVHGDPGDIDIKTILGLADRIINPAVLQVAAGPVPAADVSVGTLCQHHIRGLAELISVDRIGNLRISKFRWMGHRFAFITWTEFLRADRKAIKQAVRLAKLHKCAPILLGTQGRSRLRTVAGLCKKVGLRHGSLGLHTIGFPKEFDLAGTFSRKGVPVFELEKS